MTRFLFITLLAIIAFFAIGFFLHGSTRWWALTAFWIVYFTVVGCGIAFIQLQFFGPAMCQVQSGVALTFDDGPHPVATPALLDLLKQENVSATFFCIGKHVAAHPAIARRIVEEGHLISNHTFHHSGWTAFLGQRQLSIEIQLTQNAIKDATGITPKYMRPPMGLTNPHYNRVLKQAGMHMAGWDVRSLDTFCTSTTVINRVLKKTRDGSIILLHDNANSPTQLIQSVTHIIHELRSRQMTFVRLDHPV